MRRVLRTPSHLQDAFPKLFAGFNLPAPFPPALRTTDTPAMPAARVDGIRAKRFVHVVGLSDQPAGAARSLPSHSASCCYVGQASWHAWKAFVPLFVHLVGLADQQASVDLCAECVC